MMARSTNAPFKGRIQKRKTNHLQIITFGLQRTAGPYKGANCRRAPRPQVCTRRCRRKSSKRSLKKYIRRPCRDRAIEF